MLLSFGPHRAAVKALASELLRRRRVGERRARKVIREAMGTWTYKGTNIRS